ncbi:MAG: PH domain-containing protein [Colwellia sp.]|uniref:PH domain-containing protein n=1 Tax=Colwellia sp. TaxID=56799 RepID=UPI001D4E9C15|nr:PH domain-containing protein [Colwellia sp.]NQY58182.1 PH domain-containing protein [Ilumatobacteraceae bacterium]NQZ25943.1 PH domain-containing protein [Colwellia sp.]
MSYVNKNLLNDEKVIHKASIHWFIFIPSIIAFALSIFLIGQKEGVNAFGAFLFMFSIYMFIKAFVIRKTTELAVTSKRIIAKTGFIRRNTVELNHNKVESFIIDQSILGRIFGFGTLIINGTGGGKTPIPNIDAPLIFRKEAMQAIDTQQN